MINADEILDVGERFMAALEACDVDAVRHLYAPDARLWHNFDGQTQSVEDNLKTLAWIHKKLTGLRYDIVSRERLADGFVQQHVLRGSLPDGGEFAMPACAIVRVRNGRIVALDEYLDSTHTRPLQAQD